MNRSIFEKRRIEPVLLTWLFISITVLSCGKKEIMDPIDKTALKLSVDTAKLLIQNTVEGIKPGDYAIGSKDALLTVLNASEDILNKRSATQEEVNNATGLLETAIAVYRDQHSPNVIHKSIPKPRWLMPRWAKQQPPGNI